ncbi:hypothetical protein HMPREF1431_00477 [Helicobacter pylori GAMchJs106B]|nr:hypothetical protein HMPREF1431_00477 [Helicobacter pylori GAMchJs106B]
MQAIAPKKPISKLYAIIPLTFHLRDFMQDSFASVTPPPISDKRSHA